MIPKAAMMICWVRILRFSDLVNSLFFFFAIDFLSSLFRPIETGNPVLELFQMRFYPDCQVH